MFYQELPNKTEVSFISCGNLICEEGGMVHPARLLDTFVLLVGISGEMEIAQANTVHTLRKNTAVLLFPGVEHHGVKPASEGLSYYWYHFRLPGAGTAKNFEASGMGCRQIPEFLEISNQARIKFLCSYLLDASREERPLCKEICSHILALLLLELAGESSLSPTLAGRKSVAEVHKILEWVRLYLPEISSVGDIASHFGYNKEYLTTLVRHVTGRPLVSHLITLRISEAESLLLCSNMRVAEIARQVGFEDEKYFSRCFRKKTGSTPTQYRYANLKAHYNRK